MTTRIIPRPGRDPVKEDKVETRRHVIRELGEVGDLTGHRAVLFGDAASKHRRDLAMAV